MTSIHVVGFGNLLQGDDGFGIHVLDALRKTPLPSHVSLFDAGIMGMAAISCFEQCEHVIVIDAMASLGRPGHVRRLALADVAAPLEAFSAHEMDVHYLLRALPIVFDGAPLPSIGLVVAEIEPPDGRFCMELSPALAAAVPIAVALVLEDIGARDTARAGDP